MPLPFTCSGSSPSWANRSSWGMIGPGAGRVCARSLIVFALLGGFVALAVTLLLHTALGIAAGLAVWLTALLLSWWAAKWQPLGGDDDPSRRRFLALAGLGGLVGVAGGAAIGRAAAKLAPSRRAPAIQVRGGSPGSARSTWSWSSAASRRRSGDIQLLMASFNSPTTQ